MTPHPSALVALALTYAALSLVVGVCLLAGATAAEAFAVGVVGVLVPAAVLREVRR